MKLDSRFPIVLLATICCLLYFSFITKPKAREVPYPEGYREWTHVKTAIVGPQSPMVRYRGMHHIYANKKAMEGYKTGKFPEGSMIVFDVLDVKTDASADVSEGDRRFIDVMYKDSRYDSTGGWGFEEFDGNSHDKHNKQQAIFKLFT
jgi:hypothetical protein